MRAQLFPLPVAPPALGARGRSLVRQRQFAGQLFQDFLNFSAEAASTSLVTQSDDFWLKQGQQRALALFQQAAKRVPAYKDFLRKHKIKPALIKTFADWQRVPAVDKHNYLKHYPLEALYWDGKLTAAEMIAVSSGSSGEPFFWPRADLLEMETSYVQEMYLRNFFRADTYSTLYLDCFAMGMYIAGPIILNSALRVAQKGYPMLVITPGLAMDDIMRVIPNLGPRFDQIVLAGYPPYIKDIIEEAAERGVNWRRLKTRLILAGEGFSEQWRDYVAELAGSINIYDSIINLYGTADSSIVGHETPLSIVARRLADRDLSLRRKLFGDRYPHRLPTLIQYLPTQKYFEMIENELHFTATGGIPLVRYNIHDDGGVLTHQQVSQACQETGYNLEDELRRVVSQYKGWNLPFVYLYGRSDSTVVLYGANVYPENIKGAIEIDGLRQFLTGRFTMSIERRRNHDPYLCVHVESIRGNKPAKGLRQRVKQKLISYLLDHNDEYRVIFNAKGRKAWPTVVIHPKGDPRYFTRQRNKQRWKS